MNTSDLLERLRAICLALPGAEEYLMHGHPSFRAGKKPFVIAGEPGSPTVSIKVPLMDQPLYLEDPRFQRTHYIGQHGWITMTLEAEPDWAELERLVVASYRLVAQKRMLQALDAR